MTGTLLQDKRQSTASFSTRKNTNITVATVLPSTPSLKRRMSDTLGIVDMLKKQRTFHKVDPNNVYDFRLRDLAFQNPRDGKYMNILCHVISVGNRGPADKGDLIMAHVGDGEYKFVLFCRHPDVIDQFEALDYCTAPLYVRVKNVKLSMDRNGRTAINVNADKGPVPSVEVLSGPECNAVTPDGSIEHYIQETQIDPKIVTCKSDIEDLESRELLHLEANLEFDTQGSVLFIRCPCGHGCLTEFYAANVRVIGEDALCTCGEHKQIHLLDETITFEFKLTARILGDGNDMFSFAVFSNVAASVMGMSPVDLVKDLMKAQTELDAQERLADVRS